MVAGRSIITYYRSENQYDINEIIMMSAINIQMHNKETVKQ